MKNGVRLPFDPVQCYLYSMRLSFELSVDCPFGIFKRPFYYLRRFVPGTSNYVTVTYNSLGTITPMPPAYPCKSVYERCRLQSWSIAGALSNTRTIVIERERDWYHS